MSDVLKQENTHRELKTAYSYSSENGEYLGVVMADPDQLDSSQWLLPANATYVEPPETQDNEVAIFSGGGWVVKVDYRGTDYWSEKGEKYTVKEIGEEVPEGALLQEPAEPEPTFDQVLTSIIKKRQAAYKTESDPLYMEWQYDGTAESEQIWRDKVADIKERYPLPIEF